jgi:hypothetical protein
VVAKALRVRSPAAPEVDDAAQCSASAGPGPPGLPAWPVAVLFVLYPLWWVLGLSSVILPIVGGCCLFLLAVRRAVQLPPLWWLWSAFAIWMLASAVMLDSTGRMIGFGQRFAAFAGAGLIATYLFNAGQNLPRRRVLALLSTFLGWMTIGGYLGMAFPHVRLPTPALALAPDALAGNEYVLDLLSPRFAEVQDPWGASEAFVRPSAPFAYTNAWGHAFVLLLPVVAALAVRATRRTRLLLAALVLAALPPALATLNRGIFIGVAIAALYLAARHVRRISPARIGQIALGATLLAGVVMVSGALNRLSERTSTSSTTQDRAELYREAFRRTLDSPWLGWGAPRPSATLDVSVGTQGHFWYLMFSHGFVGLTLFLALIWGLAWRTRRTLDLESTLIHTTLVCSAVLLLFYGIDSVHLVIVTGCAVLLLREASEAWTAPARSAVR